MKAKKKSKLSFGPNGLKGFLVDHGEKVVFGGMMLLVIGFVYFGSMVPTIDKGLKPETLTAKITQARVNILDNKGWDKVKNNVMPAPINDLASARVTPEDYAGNGAELNPALQPLKKRRDDPTLYAPILPEVDAFTGALAVKLKESDPVPLLEQKILAAEDADPEVALAEPPMTKGKKKKMGDDPLDEAVRAAPKVVAPRQVDEADRERAGTMVGGLSRTEMKAEKCSVVITRFVLPYKRQMAAYEDALNLKASSANVNPERDTPNYIYVNIQKADVTANPNIDPATITWEPFNFRDTLTFTDVKKTTWGDIPQELVDSAAVITAKPERGAGMLTLPVPPLLLTDLRKFAGHKEIAWADARNDRRTDESHENVDNSNVPAIGNDPPTPDVAQPPAVDKSPVAEKKAGEVVYKLLRFFDFDVKPGHKYRYRVQVYVEDPNHPFVPPQAGGAAAVKAEGAKSLDPHPSSLAKAVENRLREVKAREDAKKIPNFREYYRLTDWSEPTPVVTVPDPTKYLVSTALVKREGSDPTSKPIPVKKALVVKWDQELAIGAIGEEEVQVGSVLNFTKDADVMHPLTREYILLKKYPFRTNAVVVDMKGGEPFDRKSSMVAPTEMAIVDHQGRLVVVSEASDIKEWQNYARVDAKTVEDETKTTTPKEGEEPGRPKGRPRTIRDPLSER